MHVLQLSVLICIYAMLPVFEGKPVTSPPCGNETPTDDLLALFMNQIGHDEREFVCNHRCQIVNLGEKNEVGLAKWTNVLLKCRNMDNLPTVICDPTCNVSIQLKRRVKTVTFPVIPFLWQKLVEHRRHGTEYLELPVACQCKDTQSTHRT